MEDGRKIIFLKLRKEFRYVPEGLKRTQDRFEEAEREDKIGSRWLKVGKR